VNALRIATIASLTLIGACADDSLPTDYSIEYPKPSAAALQLDAAANGRNERGAEDDILRLENFLPGLGGVYMEGSKIVVYVPQQMSRRDALEKLALGTATLNIDGSVAQQMMRGENIELRPAKHPFSQLVSWVVSGVGGIMRVPGVTGLDANEATNRITIFVRDQSGAEAALAAAHKAGVPEDAVETRVANPVLVSGLGGTWSPTGGGIQIQNDSSINCSLGYNDRYNDVKGFWTAGPLFRIKVCQRRNR
jgi:hypothetical protein